MAFAPPTTGVRARAIAITRYAFAFPLFRWTVGCLALAPAAASCTPNAAEPPAASVDTTDSTESGAQGRDPAGFQRSERETAEQTARRRARDWLALVDAGQYGESWESASEIFRTATSKTKWQRSAQRVRTPLGKLAVRRFRAAQRAAVPAGAPQGEYVIVHYDTTFGVKTEMHEIVTLARTTDQSWRVAGYFIQ